ncbi:uncharacterized protein LOC130825786 isoform X1 [Amaranthus tricolor]|uniref:uncharacterized protein LOC130825786 isoform X1 n=1 Tax=Amaranthus tricolor TaxID=29722 RepID=UPI00258FC352|nr:uncharacterized protein LOC130825786 isoform X1 [Amaranthus tricolor]
MTVLACQESSNFMRMPSKSLTYKSYEDTLREMEAFLDGKTDNAQSTNEVYADITEPMNSSAIRLPDSEDADATENSSSFGDTASRSENVSGTSDAEVESEFRVDNGLASTLDSYGSVFPVRRKKLTTHWRSFIQPLMWRCKWTELKIKELDSQALKYTRELEANEQGKMSEQHQHTSDFSSKSFAYFNHSGKRKFMKRRKRKLVENVADISSYMSHHQLFSYLENKHFEYDAASAIGGDVNIDLCSKNDDFGTNDDLFKDGEDSFEAILQKIENAQSNVQRLRTRLETVMLKNGVKFSSSENLNLLAPYDAQTSAAQSPAFSAGNGESMSFGPIFVQENLDDLEFNTLLSDGSEIPDIIESTVGLHPATDVTLHQPQRLESGENQNIDYPHLQNKGIDQPIDEHPKLEKKDQSISSLGARPDLVTGHTLVQDKASLKSRLTSDVPYTLYRRKRGERKARPVGWNMRSSGDPDSS